VALDLAQGRVEYRIKDSDAGEDGSPPPITVRRLDGSESPENGAEGKSGEAAKGAEAAGGAKPEEAKAKPASGAGPDGQKDARKPEKPQAGQRPAAAGPNPGTELTLDNMEETLVFPQNREIAYGDSLLVWIDNKLYRKNADGALTLLDSSLDTREDEFGQKWLTQDEEGNFLIQVSLKVWATINFEYNSARILKDSEDILTAFGQALTTPALRDFSLIIAGHTDNIGSHDFNLELSQDRASSVARWLTERMGIAPERMILSGYSYTVPIADNATPEGRAKNRRVEFVLLPSSDV
jgi:outer membrane protein OmpA-like peptidoglycan-associated protein